jgi:flagellar assembly protein FliH
MATETRLLKANAARDLEAATTFNFADLRQQAVAQISAAQAEAAAIVAQAKQEAAAIRQQAQAEGQSAGRRTGLADAERTIQQQAQSIAEARVREQLQTTLPALTAAAQALAQERDAWIVRWERVAVELGVAIAEKLIRANLVSRPDLAEGMIAEALQLAAGQPQLRVALNPSDLAHLGERAEDVVRSLAACAHPELRADPTLHPGECRLETLHGEVDARIETMLHRVTEELLAN